MKDYETLINAFERFSIERDNVVLMIVGDGSDRNKLEKIVEGKGLGKKIIFTGKRMDVAAVMNSFDVFVHTALAESFGMVIIEVMALGKPVISSELGVAGDVIMNGDNGFLREPKDTNGFATAMGAILENRYKWPSIAEKNKKIADSFAVRKTQALCDKFYLEWYQTIKRIS